MQVLLDQWQNLIEWQIERGLNDFFCRFDEKAVETVVPLVAFVASSDDLAQADTSLMLQKIIAAMNLPPQSFKIIASTDLDKCSSDTITHAVIFGPLDCTGLKHSHLTPLPSLGHMRTHPNLKIDAWKQIKHLATLLC